MLGRDYMSKTKKLVPITELKSGMIAANTIIVNHTQIVNKDTVMNNLIIKKLQHVYLKGFCKVYVDDNDDQNSSNDTPESLYETNKTFNEFSIDTKHMFRNIYKLQTSGISDVREFSMRLQKEAENTQNVIKNIVVYGSGTDSIYRHSVNVAALSTILGKWLKLDSQQLNLLSYSAILHDFGKTKIDGTILNKVTPLTESEIKIIHSHPTIGYNYVKEIPYLSSSVSYGVLMHHERVDGSGYPLGLKNNNIHQFAKIIAIADTFDAINSDRCYKKKKRPFEALYVIKKDSLEKLDYEYCNVFINHVVNYYLGEEVLLTNNKTGKIIQVDPNDLEKPLILVDSDFLDLKAHPDLAIQELIVK